MDDVDRETLERRLEAVERALSSGEPLEHQDRIDAFERRLADVEAAVEAIRGYVGTVRAINRNVENRADRALRKATLVERHFDEHDHDTDTTAVGGSPTDAGDDAGTEALDSSSETSDTAGAFDRLRGVL